jgi:SAM-dependent methyltransferase
VTRLNDPEDVRAQYADEANLKARKAIYADVADVEGPDAREEAIRAVVECAPRRVLEVGGGEGEMALRILEESECELAFVDQSERMVEIARGKGIDAQVADAQDLPFDDESFDCVLAAWMLYHVADVPRGLAEIARVLRPGGRLVAVTNGSDHLLELKALAGDHWFRDNPFTRESAPALLAGAFTSIEQRDLDGWVTMHDDEGIWGYLGSISAGAPAELPAHELPLRIRRQPTVFVATK